MILVVLLVGALDKKTLLCAAHLSDDLDSSHSMIHYHTAQLVGEDGWKLSCLVVALFALEQNVGWKELTPCWTCFSFYLNDCLNKPGLVTTGYIKLK